MEKPIQEYRNDRDRGELAKARQQIEHRPQAAGNESGLPVGVGPVRTRSSGMRCKGPSSTRRTGRSESNEYETEKQFRLSMAFGSFLFVFLGAPVGILFARRDFLSAFISCFVPIIALYYPFMLLGMNLGKEGSMDPTEWRSGSAMSRCSSARRFVLTAES